MTKLFLRFAFLGVFFLCQTAYADVLVLNNGDRISGEIKKIWDNEITIEPSYSDEFKVDLPAVDHIESDREFDIELEDGREIVGQLGGADTDGKQLITAGEESFAVPLANLFELDEPEKTFNWESNIEFSAALNSGNTDSSNAKLKADTIVEIPGHRHLGEITFFKEEQIGVVTQEQDLFKYSYNWLFREPWFFSTNLSFERDPIIELDQRIIISAGIGLDIWNTPRKELSVQLGIGAQTETLGSPTSDPVGPATSESSVGTWSMRYRQEFFSDDLELYHNNSITTNINGRTNISYKTTTGLRFEVTDLLYANLSVDFDYETDPVDAAEKEDVALLIGIGLEF
jgi:putative salt-induced outer membrane protein YdiY